MTIKSQIIEYLKGKDFVFGGAIEDFIRETDHAKASNASRRCRELEDEGKLESRYVKVDGTANKVVQYRLKPPLIPTYRVVLPPAREVKSKQLSII